MVLDTAHQFNKVTDSLITLGSGGIAMRGTVWVLSLLLTAEILAAENRGLKPEDFYREVTVADVAVSPGGKLVAFTVMTIVEEKNARHQEIWMQELEDGMPSGEPFPFTAPTEESEAPVWSPDGSLLGFRSQRGEEQSTWFLRVSSPGGEAFRIEGVEGDPIWSPDGNWIAYVRAEEAVEGERLGWVAPDAITRTLDTKRFDGRVVTSTRYKIDGKLPLQPHFRTQPKKDLFVVPAAGGAPRKLTSGAFDVLDVTWSRDGAVLYFAADANEDEELDPTYRYDIYAVSREGGDARALTTNPGNDRAPSVSPDGEWMAYLRSRERGAETDVMVVRLASNGAFGGTPRNLTESWDLDPRAPAFSPDGASVGFMASTRGNEHAFEAPREGGAVRQVTTGDRQLGRISSSTDGRVWAYSASDAVTPAELYVLNRDRNEEFRATRFNEAWLSELTLVAPERMTWRVQDGTEIEGWLVKPVGYEPGRKYPLVLKIHGGPHSAYGNVFFRTFHVLSARGFFVLYPNPRGSSGYGHQYQYATRGSWGELDSEDYLGGLDAAIARYGDIDPMRIGVSGGSYGGFMTNWLSATTDRFAAAVTSRSITNWESWYGTSDAQGLTEYEFHGAPWEKRDVYRRLSPISYVENVKIPTLIIHSEQDHRTPIADGEQWFMALKKRGVPVEIVRYPRSSHGLSRTGEPWLLVDRLERLASWFEHWLIEARVTPTTNP
jgi:dipeptidyl aminopeptidase/acylaminoacyl peptidase